MKKQQKKEYNNDIYIEQKIENSFWGGIIGDALGTPIEFVDYSFVESFGPIVDFLNNNSRNIIRGMYSDDTCMTLALMDSLVDCNSINLQDQMIKYNDWLYGGKYSCTNYSFGCGKTTKLAIDYYNKNNEYRDNSLNVCECGNGSLMRTAPIVWFYINKSENFIISKCKQCSTLTHNHMITKNVCGIFGSILYNILLGEKDKNKLLDFVPTKLYKEFVVGNSSEFYNLSELCKIFECDYNEFDTTILPTLKDNKRITGYAPMTLMCALYAFITTDNFYDGMIKAINIPGDCDTIGSVYGQLAGAYYSNFSNKNIQSWYKRIQNLNFLNKMINKFLYERVNDNA